MTPAQRDISRKLRILNYAKQIGNVTAACRHFGISREIFYRWKRAYEKDGEQALVKSNPALRTRSSAQNRRWRIFSSTSVGHITSGEQRIAWRLELYHGITISAGGVRSYPRRLRGFWRSQVLAPACPIAGLRA